MVVRKLVLLPFAVLLLLSLPIIASSEKLLGQSAWLVLIGSFAMIIALLVYVSLGWRCPRCGYPMYLRKTARGDISVPWPPMQCGPCKLDLDSPYNPSDQFEKLTTQ